jgi:hypothetical protein
MPNFVKRDLIEPISAFEINSNYLWAVSVNIFQHRLVIIRTKLKCVLYYRTMEYLKLIPPILRHCITLRFTIKWYVILILKGIFNKSEYFRNSI